MKYQSIENGRVELVDVRGVIIDKQYGLEGITECGEKVAIKRYVPDLLGRKIVCRGERLHKKTVQIPEVKELIEDGYKFASFLTDDIPTNFRKQGYGVDEIILMCMWTKEMQKNTRQSKIPIVDDLKKYFDIGWMYPLFLGLNGDRNISPEVISTGVNHFNSFREEGYDTQTHKEHIIRDYIKRVSNIRKSDREKVKGPTSTAPLVFVIPDELNDLGLAEVYDIITDKDLQYLTVKPVRYNKLI